MVQQLESKTEVEKSQAGKGDGADVGHKVLAEQHAGGEKVTAPNRNGAKDSAAAVLPGLEITGADAGAEKKVKITINENDTLSGIAAKALGPHAERRDIYNYVNQLAKHNHIANKDMIYAKDSLELVEYKDPRQAKPVDNQGQQGNADKTDNSGQVDKSKSGKDGGQVDGNNGQGTDSNNGKGATHGDGKDQNVTPNPDVKKTPDGGQNVAPVPVDGSSKDGVNNDSQVPGPDGKKAKADDSNMVDNSGSNLDKTMHVAGLAMEGAKDHIAEHPLLVGTEIVAGTAAGVVLATTAPVWLTAGVAIAGIGYLGKTMWDKGGEVIDSLHTIYADKVHKDELDQAEKTVKHDLGVGVVDGAGIIVGGVGTKLIVGKMLGKAGAAAAGEESAEAADELAKESAKQAAKQGGSEASNEAADETAKEGAKQAAQQTNTGTGDKTGGTAQGAGDKSGGAAQTGGDKTGGTAQTGGDKTGASGEAVGDKNAAASQTGGDKTAANNQPAGDKSGADKSVADKNGQQPAEGSDSQKHSDAPAPVKPEGPQGGSSDWVGNKYENADGSFRQEDSHWVSKNAEIAVVSDGMGGHGGGDAASRIATDVMESRAALLPENAGQAEKEAWLRDSIKAAAERIKEAEEQPTYTAADGTVLNTNKGMGATIVASIKHEGKMLIAWAGDSRVYRIRDGNLEQLTEDHSWANQAKKMLGMSDADIAAHPNSAVIHSSLGNHKLEIGETVAEIKPGDRFILASDGLESLDQKTIVNAVQHAEHPSDAAHNLIQAVRDRLAAVGGTQDNVTAVVLEPEAAVVVPEAAAASEQTAARILNPAHGRLSDFTRYGAQAGVQGGIEQVNEIAKNAPSLATESNPEEEYITVSDFPGDAAPAN